MRQEYTDNQLKRVIVFECDYCGSRDRRMQSFGASGFETTEYDLINFSGWRKDGMDRFICPKCD